MSPFPTSTINATWIQSEKNTNKAYVESATAVLGFRKTWKKEWITPDTWKKIGERKDLKAKMLNTKPPRLQEQAQLSY